MPLDAAPYRTEPLPDGVRFVLPRRQGGRGGICLILFGLMFSGFAVFWILGATGLLDPLIDSVTGSAMPAPSESPAEFEDDEEPVESPEPSASTPAPKPPSNPPQPRSTPPSNSSGGFDIGRLFFGLFGIPFFLAGLMPITIGIMAIFGHSEIEVTAAQVCSIDRAGPIRLRKCRPADQLTHFQIGRPTNLTTSQQSQLNRKPQPKFMTHAIHAHFGESATITMASGYSIVTLRDLAKDIAGEHQRITGRDRVQVIEDHDEHASDEVERLSNEPAIPETVPPQPMDSRVSVDRLSSGLTFRVPPTGFRKGSLGLLLFGLFWCGFVSLFTLAMIGMGVPWEMFLFISIFWAVGIAMLLAGINLARKQAVLDVVHDTLLVTRQSLFGRGQHEWRAEDLADIRVDHSGMTVNNKAVLNLQIIPREGRVLGLFTGRDETELHWLAAELRVAMGMRKRD